MAQSKCDNLKEMLRETPHMMKDEKMLWFCVQEKLLPSMKVNAWAKRKRNFLGELATYVCKSGTPEQLEKLLKCFKVKREDAWESGEGVVCLLS